MAAADYQLKLKVNSVDVGESRHLSQWSDVNTHQKRGTLSPKFSRKT